MELLEGGEESNVIERGYEEQMELHKDVVTRLEEAHTDDMVVKPCVAKRKNRGEQCGRVLVERQRRKQNDGVTMLQKGMKLKEKKNLGSLEGNSFAPLHIDSLNQIVQDVRFKVGNDASDAESFINKFIGEEQSNFDRFVGENPEIFLPVNLDIEVENVQEGGVDEKMLEKELHTPEESIKDSDPSLKWSEVVRRCKTRCRNEKIGSNKRRVLQY
jgi:hypothetical protein